MQKHWIHGVLRVAGCLAAFLMLLAPQVVTAQPATVPAVGATRLASAVAPLTFATPVRTAGSATVPTATRAPSAVAATSAGGAVQVTPTRPAPATAPAVIPATGNPADGDMNTGLVVALAIAGLLGAAGLATRLRPQGRRLL